MVVRIDKQEDPTKKQQAPQTDLCLILFFLVWNHRLYIIYINLFAVKIVTMDVLSV